MKAGIVSYGVSVPVNRIKVEEISKVWQNAEETVVRRVMRMTERGVLQADEDTITLAADAVRKALDASGLKREEIGALYLGTQTSPYASRASSSVLVEMCGLNPDIFCGDCQFSGKSGTIAIQIVAALVEAGMIKYGLAIGADSLSLHIAPGDPLEFTAAAGAAAFIIGEERLIAGIEATASWVSDTPDYFRLDGDRYIHSGGQSMTATEVGLPEHVRKSVGQLLDRSGSKPEDFKYAVFHQLNGAAPFRCGAGMGFKNEQIAPGVYADMLGDCGAASSLIGLARVLDEAISGDRIMLASYGFGAGSDAFILKVTEDRKSWKPVSTVKELIGKRILVDYATAAKLERKYHLPEWKVTAFY